MSLDVDSTTDTGDMSLRPASQVTCSSEHATYCLLHCCTQLPNLGKHTLARSTTLEKGCGLVNSNSVVKSCYILCNLFLDKG